MISHTFLFEPARWRANGFFWDSENRRFPAEGHVEITHTPTVWKNVGVMRVLIDTPLELANHYEIVPPSPGDLTINWSSMNPAIGRLIGTFTLVGDAIISLYRSERDDHWGTEHLRMVSADTYVADGVFFAGRSRLSSWNVCLRRDQVGHY